MRRHLMDTPPASRKYAINLLNTPWHHAHMPMRSTPKIFAKKIKSSQTPFLCLNIKSWPKHKRGISLGIKMANQKQKRRALLPNHMQLRVELTLR